MSTNESNQKWLLFFLFFFKIKLLRILEREYLYDVEIIHLTK